jgi:hypothetical protein
LQQLKEKEENEKKESIHQSYEWLKKEEEMKSRNKNYVSKFLMLSSK